MVKVAKGDRDGYNVYVEGSDEPVGLVRIEFALEEAIEMVGNGKEGVYLAHDVLADVGELLYVLKVSGMKRCTCSEGWRDACGRCGGTGWCR